LNIKFQIDECKVAVGIVLEIYMATGMGGEVRKGKGRGQPGGGATLNLCGM
jgi:hypothetical protein